MTNEQVDKAEELRSEIRELEETRSIIERNEHPPHMTFDIGMIRSQDIPDDAWTVAKNMLLTALDTRILIQKVVLATL